MNWRRNVTEFRHRNLARWRYLTHHPAFKGAPARVLWRLALWRFRCLLGRDAEVPLASLGIRMSLPPDWRGSAKLIYAFQGEYDPELTLMSELCINGGTVVDVGANLGIYALSAARALGKHGKVLAVEPSAQTCERLRRNVALNGFSNVEVHQVGLADGGDATMRLYHSDDPTRHSFSTSAGPVIGWEEVRSTTLDSLVAASRIGQITLIKIDVEGAEDLVLRGAHDALRRWRPHVIFEVNPEAAKGLGKDGNEAWTMLEELGYGFYRATGRSLVHLECLPAGGNVVAIAKQRR
jgi:FkbM family methyltransferase